MSNDGNCVHGTAWFACSRCNDAYLTWKALARIETTQIVEIGDGYEAMCLLRELVALDNETHPNGHTSDECAAWQDDCRRRNDEAWGRARALVERAGKGRCADEQSQ